MRVWFLLAAIAPLIAGCSKPDLASKAAGALTVQSNDFPNGAIPPQFSADGGNAVPALSWSNPPPGTQSIAVIMDDSDANGFTHWLAYNLPGSALQIGKTDESSLGKNDSGTNGYYGPKPPPGSTHHYHFHVYALKARLGFGAGASKEDVLQAMSGLVLAQGEFVATFQSGKKGEK